jgi:two-component system, OmpR family, sensor histidine kinase MprB
MGLRRRLTLAAAGAVAVAVVLAALVGYLAVRRELYGQVDDQLRRVADQPLRVPARVLADPGIEGGFPAQPGPRDGGRLYFALVDAEGEVAAPPGQDLGLAPDATDRAVAAGRRGTVLRDRTVSGVHVRAITVRAGDLAVVAARPVDELDRVLGQLRLVLALVCVGGIGLAALLGRLVSRNLVAPITEVSAAAEHIARTDDLGRRIVVRRPDEVGELAGRFNTMLDRLEASRAELGEAVRAQRRLVADASHELRTPITSLRTNIEVLLDSSRPPGAGLPEDARARLLRDVEEQIEELGALVVDLIELARGDEPPVQLEDVRLDELAAEAVDRARRHAPRLDWRLSAQPTVVAGVPDRLGRALNNLVDNAARHSPPAGTVEVRVDAGGIEVRDYGPGVEDADIPHLFDRFYRGAAARGTQGSGLGLAIVRQVAETHGGHATVSNAPGGGAAFRLDLPAQLVGATEGDGATAAEVRPRPAPRDDAG